VRLPINQRSRRHFVIATIATAAALAWATSPAGAVEGWTAATEVLVPGRAAQFDGQPDTDQPSGQPATDAVSTGSGSADAAVSTAAPQVVKAPRPHTGKIILPVIGGPQTTQSPTVAANPVLSHPAVAAPTTTAAPTQTPTQPAATEAPSTAGTTQPAPEATQAVAQDPTHAATETTQAPAATTSAAAAA
jgi:hypothetical protein